MDYSAILAAVAGGVVTLIGQGAATAVRQRGASKRHQSTASMNLDQHRDKLTFELLQAARDEVAAARAEATELRQLQSRLRHFDEALEHIEALLAATLDSGTWESAARHARSFLKRMEGSKNAGG